MIKNTMMRLATATTAGMLLFSPAQASESAPVETGPQAVAEIPPEAGGAAPSGIRGLCKNVPMICYW